MENQGKKLTSTALSEDVTYYTIILLIILILIVL